MSNTIQPKMADYMDTMLVWIPHHMTLFAGTVCRVQNYSRSVRLTAPYCQYMRDGQKWTLWRWEDA